MRPNVQVDGRRVGSLRPDQSFPAKFVNVLDAEDRWLMGTPFAVIGAPELRAWAEAFAAAADDLDGKRAQA